MLRKMVFQLKNCLRKVFPARLTPLELFGQPSSTVVGREVGGLYSDNGKEKGNYYSILGLYIDNGKENRNYYSTYWDDGKLKGSDCSILRLHWDNGT